MTNTNEPSTGAELLDQPAHAGPTSQEPLQGLERLGPIALHGAKRIRELAAQSVDWAWQDYAVSGTIVVLAGPSSEGKTTLTFLLMLARAAQGEPLEVCGRLVKPAPPGSYVVVIEAEHGEPSTARKLVKSAALLGLGDEALDRVITVSRKAVKLGSPEWRDVERMIEAGIVSDVAIDTLARVCNGDSNSEEDQAANFEAIAAAIERAPQGSQPTFWVLAHTRKGTADTLQDVSGSTQRVAQADSVLLVNGTRDKNGQIVASTVTLVKAREEPEEYPAAMTLRIQDGRLAMAAESGARCGRGVAVNPEHHRRVLAGIAEHGWISAGKLAKAIGMRPEAVCAVARYLESIGDMAARPAKPNGDSNGWDLAGSLAEHAYAPLDAEPWATDAAA